MTFYLYSKDPSNKKVLDNIYYFDNNSTTLIEDNSVKKEIYNWISCGNPSNILHDLGKMAKDKIEECRHFISYDLKISPNEMYFTSGATESNNMIIQGLVKKYLINKKKFTIITSSFEHPSVHNIFKYLESNNFLNIIYINPCKNKNSNKCGTILPETILKSIVKSKYPVKLISIMYANNETGAINDIKSIGKICKKYNIFFHCDATQALGKYIIYPKKLNIDSMTFSAHKFHGPKGIGGLYLNSKKKHYPNICYGGEQELHRRPGTENVANIAGMTQALRIAHTDREKKNKDIIKKRDYIEQQLCEKLNIEILGCKKHRLPNTIFCLIKDLGNCNKVLVKKLNQKKIYISVGSACQTNKKSSHVLDTLDINPDDAIKIVRISTSDYTTEQEVRYFVYHFIKIVKKMIKKKNITKN